MKEVPMVSVLLACYNQEKFIGDCLKGILSQSYTDIELIISDDCSADGTVDIIKPYLKELEMKFPRVIFESNPKNLGLIQNHMKLGNMAQGKYIHFLAGDDIFLPDFIKESVLYMESHPEYAMCYSNTYLVPEDYRFGQPLYPYPKFQRPETVRCGFHLFEDLILGTMWLNATSVLMKRDKFVEYGGFDEEIGIEDTNLWLTLARLEGIGYFEKSLICYRKTRNSVSSIQSGNTAQKFRFAFEAEIKTYQKHVVYLENEELRTQVMNHKYLKYYCLAMDCNLNDEFRRLNDIIKSNHIKLPFRMHIQKFFYLINSYEFYNKIRYYYRGLHK